MTKKKPTEVLAYQQSAKIKYLTSIIDKPSGFVKKE